MSPLVRAASFLALGTALACGGPRVPNVPGEPPVRAPHRAARVLVGTARADITMPPGPSLFGHGPDARPADGFWTRQYCRVFYFESEAGQKLALVPCELAAMSLLLQRRVAEQTADLLHASQLMMTATHTHAGVGHYFGARQYTSVFSSRLPGYDDAIARELSSRIARAVREAVQRKRPARLAWRHGDDFWCFTRNRSLAARRFDAPGAELPAAPPCAAGRPELCAVDPALDVLKIDAYDPDSPARDLGPIGSLSFFAMHPTVIRSANQLFGGDVLGVVSRRVEAELRREHCRDRDGGTRCDPDVDPLHAVVNGAEGDVSPVWSVGDTDEAIRIGLGVAAAVWAAHPARPGQTEFVLDSRYAEDDLAGARFRYGGDTLSLCRYAELGQGAARGATDHPTSATALDLFSRDPAADYGAEGCQAPKIPMLGALSQVTRGSGSFPRDVPLAVAQLGDALIAFVPAELTTMTGWRLKQRVLRELAAHATSPRRAIIAGLANEYVQYVATEEEYRLQDYEGASTLYGPNSARYFESRIALLAKSIFDPGAEHELREHGVEIGRAREARFGFGPALDTSVEGPNPEAERRLLGTCTMPVQAGPPSFCVFWSDGGPRDVPLWRRHGAAEPWLTIVNDARDAQRIRLCLPDSLGTCDPWGTIDDRGFEFRTRIHERRGSGWIWSTAFAPAAATWAELGRRAARIDLGGSLRSAPFSAASLPARCTVPQARLCLEGARTEDWDALVPE